MGRSQEAFPGSSWLLLGGGDPCTATNEKLPSALLECPMILERPAGTPMVSKASARLHRLSRIHRVALGGHMRVSFLFGSQEEPGSQEDPGGAGRPTFLCFCLFPLFPMVRWCGIRVIESPQVKEKMSWGEGVNFLQAPTFFPKLQAVKGGPGKKDVRPPLDSL